MGSWTELLGRGMINYFGFGLVDGGSWGGCLGEGCGDIGVVPGNFGVSGGGGTDSCSPTVVVVIGN